jgi:hypothetical protein
MFGTWSEERSSLEDRQRSKTSAIIQKYSGFAFYFWHFGIWLLFFLFFGLCSWDKVFLEQAVP